MPVRVAIIACLLVLLLLVACDERKPVMKSHPLPLWAQHFSAERYELFLSTLKDVLNERGKPYELDAAQGTWMLTGTGADHAKNGLANLAQECNLIPESEWRSDISNFLARSEAAYSTARTAMGKGLVRETLRSRPWAKSETPYLDVLISRPLGGDLVEVLMADLPESTATIKQDQLEKAGLSAEQAFQIARENNFRYVHPKHFQGKSKGGTILHLFSSEDFFVAGLALNPRMLMHREPKQGFIVAVPSRHSILVSFGDEFKSLGDIQSFVDYAKQRYVEGPGSISPAVYWVHGSTWTELSISDNGNSGFTVAGPSDFIEAVTGK